MARKHLTDIAVSNHARPAKGRKEVSDSEAGLFLWITASGVKSWAVIYRLPNAEGKRTVKRKTVIGRHPAMGVADARERAREIMALASKGIDPEAKAADDKADAERASLERQLGSFGAVTEDYIAAMKAGKLVGGRKRPVVGNTIIARHSLLNRLVLPSLGSLPLDEISQTKVARLLAEIDKTDGPVDETLKVIRNVFKFAMSRGIYQGVLPTMGMTKRQSPMKTTRALADNELKSIWNAAGHLGWPFGSVVQLLMLTGQRKMEIAALRWEDVDFERRLLVIPSERVKNRAGAHEVPLTEEAISILRGAEASCQAVAGKAGSKPSSLVFPSETGTTPISGWTKLKASLDRTVCGFIAGLSDEERRAIRAGGALRPETRQLKAGALAKVKSTPMSHWRIHDLRHTFITRCRDGEENAEGEIVWSAPLDVLQATVNHEITSGVTRVYDHGDIQRRYRLRKRELIDWWSGKLLAIVDG